MISVYMFNCKVALSIAQHVIFDRDMSFLVNHPYTAADS